MGSGPSITQMALSGLHFNLVRITYTTSRQQNNNKINNKNNDGTCQTRESNLCLPARTEKMKKVIQCSKLKQTIST